MNGRRGIEGNIRRQELKQIRVTGRDSKFPLLMFGLVVFLVIGSLVWRFYLVNKVSELMNQSDNKKEALLDREAENNLAQMRLAR